MTSTLLIAMSAGFIKTASILALASGLLMGLVSGLRKLFLKNKVKFLVYVLITLLLFSATAFLSNKKVLNDIPLNNFIAFQLIFLALGLLHVFALRKIFPDLLEKQTDFWLEFLYTIVIGSLGLIGFFFIVGNYKPSYDFIFLASAISFIIPFMIVKLYEYSISIPVRIYKKWAYPVDKRIQDPKNEELINPLVISFEFNKGKNLDNLSNFRLKAPEKMEFGKLFYFFINDYNDRHPESEIGYMDDDNTPFDWIFYTKPKWYSAQRHIDFSRTIEGNNIKEDDVIMCKRV